MKSCERIMFILGNYGRKWVQDFDLEGIAYRFLAVLLTITVSFLIGFFRCQMYQPSKRNATWIHIWNRWFVSIIEMQVSNIY